MKLAQLSILAVLAIASQSAFAQTAPMSPSMPSSGSGATQGGTAAAGAGDATAVTNTGSALVSDVNTDDTIITTTTVDAPAGEMANTGGEPEIMLIAGLLLASGGLLLRRKTGNQVL